LDVLVNFHLVPPVFQNPKTPTEYYLWNGKGEYHE